MNLAREGVTFTHGRVPEGHVQLERQKQVIPNMLIAKNIQEHMTVLDIDGGYVINLLCAILDENWMRNQCLKKV